MNLPSLHGNWVDLAILLEIFFYLLGGWARGLFLGILDLGGLLLSFFVSIRFYSFFGELLVSNFSLPRGISNAVGFLLGGLFTEIILSIVINLLFKKIYPLGRQKIEDKKSLKTVYSFDKLLGFIPVLGEALIFTAFILTLLVTLPIQGAVKKDIVASKIGGPLVAKTQGIERQLNNIFGAAVNETLTFLTINPSPASSEKVDLKFTQKEIKIDEGAEELMWTLINQERIKAGIGQLAMSSKLRELARDYARDMFARGYFSHYNPEGQSPFDRMEKRGITFIAAGENLALAPNVYLAHHGLMNSPGHRKNILSADFGKVGIGVIDGGIYGEMFVQEFTD